MVLQINPYQPYQVKLGLPLSFQQIQILTQCYQPIVGAKAISLYLTLAHQPQEKLQWSYRMMHSRLLPVLNMGVKDFNQARTHLEAVDLIRTFRDEASHDDYLRQTIYYEIQMPLAGEHFFKHPQLSLALFNQIGDEAYYSLLRLWKKEDMSQSAYSEISLPFNEVFKASNQSFRHSELQEATEGIQFQDQYPTIEWTSEHLFENFDLKLFYQILRTKQVEKTYLNQAVLTQIAALSQFYELDEEAMAQVVQLAQNSVTQQIDVEALRVYASKHRYFKERSKGEKQGQEILQPSSNEALAELKHRWQEQYPSFTRQEIEILLICERMNPIDFLNQIKEEAGGFATSSEHFYLKELLEKSRLKPSVLNFLVYYLIVMQGHANFEKGRSNRLANEWQREEISSPAQALNYLHQQRLLKDKQKDMKAKQTANVQAKSWAKKTNQRQELIPSWLKDRQAQNNTDIVQKPKQEVPESSPSKLKKDPNHLSDSQQEEKFSTHKQKAFNDSQLNEWDIRNQLQNLLKKGDE